MNWKILASIVALAVATLAGTETAVAQEPALDVTKSVKDLGCVVLENGDNSIRYRLRFAQRNPGDTGQVRYLVVTWGTLFGSKSRAHLLASVLYLQSSRTFRVTFETSRGQGALEFKNQAPGVITDPTLFRTPVRADRCDVLGTW